MKITVDNTTDTYLNLVGIISRCQESLERMDSDDPLRFNVECLMDMAIVEREKVALTLPF
jgi:hypothetical protein